MTPELEMKLAKETERQLDYISKLAIESDAYPAVMDEIRKNCTIMTNELKVNNEAEQAYEDRQLQQVLEEQKRKDRASELEEQKRANRAEIRAKIAQFLVEAGVTVGTAILTAGIYVAMFKAGLEFEEGNSITSLFFKNFLGKLRPQ